MYGKYFYNHQQGESAQIDDSRFDFSGINSHKTRLGARLYYNIAGLKPFVGMAWDREYKATAESRVYLKGIDNPTLKGNSGMLELGVQTMAPTKTGWTLDASIQGFSGSQQGIQGQMKARCIF